MTTSRKAGRAGATEPPRPVPAVVVRRDADGVPLMANGERNPTGPGRYCPPRVCHCGSCPWWSPMPPYRVPQELRHAR